MDDQTDTHYETVTGLGVDVIRRSIPLIESEVAEDLRPFFYLTSLFQDIDEHASTRLLRGNLTNIKVSSETMDLTFTPFGAPSAHRQLAPVRSSVLTIWRVQNVLDSLQAFFSSEVASVYLQTGGEALISLLTELKPTDTGAIEAIDLFNEPILAVQTWRGSKG